MKIYDIIVIGAGPAGFTAAIYAGRAGKSVLIIEHNDRAGQKILSTGNGKCNITNLSIDETCYNSDSDIKKVWSIVKTFPPAKVIEFMESMGLYTKSKNGYIYPYSEQASSVLDVLRRESEHAGVTLSTGTHIRNIKYSDKWHIDTDKGMFCSGKLIIATGSKCAPKTGSDGSGYEIAGKLGHSIVPVIPALCAVNCNDRFFKEIQGVRADAVLSVSVKDRKTASERGELQLTAGGISGIPVFQISRHVKRLIDSGNKPVVDIDLIPDKDEKELESMVRRFVRHNDKIDIQSAVSGIINKKLAVMIVRETGIKPSSPCASVTTEDCINISHKIKALRVHPVDTKGFDSAQVCAGGVSMDEIDVRTMESLIKKNLYFAGEILDADGKCGGYNLEWAWASGRLAGINAAEN